MSFPTTPKLPLLLLPLLSFLFPVARGQSVKRCEGDIGAPDWVCEPLTPVPLDAFGEFYPLPGSQDPANPVKFAQIAGSNPSFDVLTGERNNGTASDTAADAVFVLTDGSYFCMLAERYVGRRKSSRVNGVVRALLLCVAVGRGFARGVGSMPGRLKRSPLDPLHVGRKSTHRV